MACYGHLSVRTGQFSGIIHSMNGISSVLISCISGHKQFLVLPTTAGSDRCRKIVAVGKNYRKHVAEMAQIGGAAQLCGCVLCFSGCAVPFALRKCVRW